MNQKTLVLAAGAFVGILAAPYVVQALGIEVKAGIGMDDFVTAAVVVAGVLLADNIL